MKPPNLKPNRLDRTDRLELIMADQESLGMNSPEVASQEESRVSPKERRQARRLLHYLTDDETQRKTSGSRS